MNYNHYYERLLKTKDELDNLIKNYQMSAPVNNFISTNTTNSYELKKLNEGEEAENILISTDTIFIGNGKMQIKKLDGTLEKYHIEKYYPVDEKDEMIKTLHAKVEELERRLNDEHTESIESTSNINESTSDDDVSIESEPTTSD